METLNDIISNGNEINILPVWWWAMTRLICEEILTRHKDILLTPYILWSHRNAWNKIQYVWREFEFINRDILSSKISQNNLIAVDYSCWNAVLENITFYINNKIDFILWTTWFYTDEKDPAYLETISNIEKSDVLALLSPNMSPEVLMILDAVRYLWENYPDRLSNFKINITESHQATKKDTSWTAKKMIEYFRSLGIKAWIHDINKIRDAVSQVLIWVTEELLQWHWWHDYKIFSPDRTVEIWFTHNVNWRQTYVNGTIAAIRFLHEKKISQKKDEKNIFDMYDVLKS